jgi:hypothetical protein
MKLITSLSEVMKMREINEVLIPLKISGISVIYPTGLDKVYLRILQCKKTTGCMYCWLHHKNFWTHYYSLQKMTFMNDVKMK